MEANKYGICDCLHVKEEHYNGEGECQLCACTWYHPGITSRICNIINEAFSVPVMPDGFVKATDASEVYDKPTIALRIGARNVTFALDGEWMGQGTDLASEWFVVDGDDSYLHQGFCGHK